MEPGVPPIEQMRLQDNIHLKIRFEAVVSCQHCNDPHKRNEIIHKVEDYFRHHPDLNLLQTVVEHYIYPDMYMVDLGRHPHHFHEHPHHHGLEHLVHDMDNLNNECVSEILYRIEEILGLPHLGKTTPITHAPHHTTTTTPAPITTTKVPFTTTTAPTTTTVPPLNVSHTCNGLEFVQTVAIGKTVVNTKAGLCTDGTHSQSEALVLKTCHAADPATWSKGYNVMQNCPRIPKYTPISTFVFGMYPMDGSAMSGVFIKCTSDGFQMSIQVCGHGPLIFNVHAGPGNQGRENANNYYTIDW
ncbi:uncharacterized protein LOC133181249 [Saccostrea echinata]|uniref:uncharacterized protein LOC133181249 n=1 Tax=Saccostrea echinata TaxID=191078 RepID=UPI002A81931E|nr:uncharacterized protein LOC133181249 [Saccostrea echinata]